jgi:tetratricopeptide (TPR) repeat protein
VAVSLAGEARRRLDGGDPGSARLLAERALARARELDRPDEIGPAAQLLGECLYAIGDVAAAWPLAEEALRVDEARGDAAAIGMDLNLLGVLQITVGQVDDALETLRRSYDLRLATLGEDHEDTIESLNNVGVALFRSGDADQAIRTHADALRRCERALGEGHRRTAETLNALAVKVEALPDGAARSQELYERALASAELALGLDADLVARLAANVGMARMNAGDRDGARPMLDRALELHERHFGPGSRWTAHVLEAQGHLANAEERHADARRAFERAFVIRVEELGAADPETLEAAVGLLATLGALSGESDEAAAEATALYMPLIVLRPDLANPFFAGAPTDPSAAGAQLRAIAGRVASRMAPDADQIAARQRADALIAEADAAHLAGDLGTAADRLREAIALLEAAYGAQSTLLVEPLHRLRLVLRMAGTETEVLGILERIAAILAGAYGSGHPLAVRALGEQYWQERREYGPAGGRDTQQRVRVLMEGTLGTSNPLVAMLGKLIDAADADLPLGAQPDAEPLSVRRERFLAEPHPVAEELLADLASVPWPSLEHAYAAALDTPQHLRVLVTDDERLRSDALDLLGESLLHQGTTYPATAPAMRFMRRLALDPRVPGRAALIDMLAAGHVAADMNDDADLRVALGDIPELLSRLAASDPDPAVVEGAVTTLEMMRQGGPWN